MLGLPAIYKDGILVQPPNAYYKVHLTYSVWPEIYGDSHGYSFPTEKSAVTFAKCNISKLITKARITSPFDEFVAEFEYPLREDYNAYNETPSTER